MKKKLIVMLILSLSLTSFTACGSSSSSSSNSDSSNTSTVTNSSLYKDGEYKATYSSFDSHGWKSQLDIVIGSGKITNVSYDSVSSDGKLKSVNNDYEEKMKKIEGLGPKEYIPKLNNELLTSQDVSKVDAVTGATQASTEFKELATAILDKAKTGDTSETILTLKGN